MENIIEWILNEATTIKEKTNKLTKIEKIEIIEKYKKEKNILKIIEEIGYIELKLEKKIKKEFLPIIAILPENDIYFIYEENNGEYKCETKDGIKYIKNFEKEIRFSRLKEKEKKEKKTAKEMIKEIALEEKKILIYITIATFVTTILTLATSFYTMQVYDRVIPTNSLSTLTTLTIGVIIAIILETIIKLSRSTLMNYSTKKIDIEYSNDIFKRFLKIRCDQIPKSIGTLSGQLQSYSTIRTFIITTATFIIIDLPFSFIFIAIVFMLGGDIMGMIPIIFLIASILIGFMYKNKIEMASKDAVNNSYRKMGLMVETIENIENIKMTNAGNGIANKWNKITEEGVDQDIKIKHYSDIANYYAVFFQQICYILLVCVGSYIVTEGGELTMGGLLAITILSGRILQPISQLPNNFMQYGKAKIAINDLEKIYTLEQDNNEIEQPLTPYIEEANIKIDEIEFQYTKENIIKFNNIEIKEGEKVAIIGPIGSGKTTLLKMIGGLYKPTKGKIYINNIDIQLIKREYLNEQINYLQQTTKLFIGTLRDNLSFGMIGINDEKIIEACKKTGLINLINSLPKGLDTIIPEGGELFSGGQKQLIGITRTIIQNKKILLLDEPTASVDEMTERNIINLLKKEIKEKETLIVVTHKPIILNLVNRIIVLNEKGILLDGKEEILKILKGENK